VVHLLKGCAAIIEDIPPSLRRGLLILLALVLAGVFLISGYNKIKDPILFLSQIRGYRLLADPYAALLSMWLPGLEVLCAVGLLIPIWRKAATFLVLSMLGVFVTALLSALFRGLDISCGCFGEGSGSIVSALVVDTILIIAALLLWRLQGVDELSKLESNSG